MFVWFRPVDILEIDILFVLLSASLQHSIKSALSTLPYHSFTNGRRAERISRWEKRKRSKGHIVFQLLYGAHEHKRPHAPVHIQTPSSWHTIRTQWTHSSVRCDRNSENYLYVIRDRSGSTDGSHNQIKIEMWCALLQHIVLFNSFDHLSRWMLWGSGVTLYSGGLYDFDILLHVSSHTNIQPPMSGSFKLMDFWILCWNVPTAPDVLGFSVITVFMKSM